MICCSHTIFYSPRSGLPEIGKDRKLYINQETGEMSIWDGDSYITIVDGGGAASPIELTLAADGSQAITGGLGVDKIRVKSTGALAAFTVGTTNGGSEVIAATVTTGDPTWDLFQVNAFSTSDYTIYFGGITASTDILIYTI